MSVINRIARHLLFVSKICRPDEILPVIRTL